MKIIFNKQIFSDIFINIVSNALPIAILQLLVNPIIAKMLGAESNGTAITIIALLHLSIVVLSTSLSNTRLLFNKEYQQLNICGDFNIYLILFAIINTLITIGGVVFYTDHIDTIDVVSICFLSLIWMLKDYLIVEYRIKLNFKKILINNIFLSIGYIIGIAFSYNTSSWYLIYICGYLSALIHALVTTSLIKEPISKTILFPKISKKLGVLVFANLFGMLSLGFDRMILLPILGGTLVSVYYSSTVIGKMITLLSYPISYVALSYVVKKDSISTKILNIIYGSVVILGIIAYICCVSISQFALDKLYPLWSSESMRYIPFVTATAIVDMITSIMNALMLHFSHIRNQLNMQIIYVTIYIGLGLIMLKQYGLIGFAIATFIASLIKLLYLTIVIHKTVKNLNHNKKYV